MDKKYGILVICAAILVLCFVTTASARTWYVDDDGGADFTGIQEAINNASVGDTIIVHSGVYYENVVVNKSVTLMGIGQPVVDAGGAGDAITLNADGITLVGFTATGSSWFDAGIKVISNNNTITGNNACNNNWHGISFSHSSNNTITGNNACNNNPGGISLSYSSNNTITGNNACNNSNGGISLLDSSNNCITGNNVSNNNWGGIRLSSSSNNTITGNTFVNDGLSVGEPYQNTVEDNTVNGKPLVYLEDASDYKVTDAGQVILVNCSNITVENQDLSNTSVGIELWETEDCILSNNKVSNNSRNGIILFDSSNNTITGNNVCNNKYGGIYLHYSSSDNTITGNNVSSNWNGIGLYYSSTNNNIITGNNVSNNRQHGIDLYDSSNNTITGNNVSNNRQHGIDLYDSSNNTITGNNVCNNKYGGIYLHYSSSDNTITGNTFVNDGLSVGEPYQNTVEDNTVNGKPLVYLEDASDYKVTDAGQVILVNCSNIPVGNQDLSNTSVGIELWETEDCILSNNKVSNNSRNGISLYYSNNNSITGNNVCNNKYGGIYLHYSSSDNTITGNNVSSNWNGIDLRYSSNNNTITENNVSNNNRKGIYLSDSNNNTITGNTFVNDGLFVDDYYQNSVGDNIVNDKPLVYLEDMSDFVVEEAGQVILVNCNNITVENQDLSNTSVGVSLWKTGNSTISNNTVSNNSLGGIDLSSSSNNTIIHNNVYNNDFGIYSSADDNLIYLNNFIDNTDNVYYSYSRRTNIWNSTEKINYTYNSSTYTNYLGNYWDDYKDNYPDAEEIDDIGIWDTPYSIDGDKDNYPLTMRFEDYITPTPANIVIWYAHYDAAGNDHYNLNDEYIVLKNIGGTSINFGGWVMKDKENHTYVFPSFELQPGATVTIRTGSGTGTATDLYWGSKRAIWNNKGDTVYLYGPNNNLVATKSW